ncbi:MAG: T9SS type A sorting domain-containing protein [Bacteroidales bacterium]|nr:T9SS type A sorting domain-containing protein [Bacteroidales bacterium]
MKLLLFFAILQIYTISSLFSQNTFEINVSTSVSEGINDFLEEETGSFLGVGYQGEINPVDESMVGIVIRISIVGDTTIKLFSSPDTGYSFGKVIRSYDNQYYIFGSTISSFQEHNQNLLVIKMDTGLNIVWKKIYDFSEQAHSLIQLLNDTQGGFHIISRIFIDYKPYTLFCRLDKDCDTIKSKIINEFGPNSVSDAMYSLDSSQLYIFGTGFGSGAGSRVVFDTSYNYDYITFLPDQPLSHMQAMRYSDTTLVYAAIYPDYSTQGPQSDDIGISISDTSFSNMNIKLFGAVDTVDYTADGKTFDFRDPDSIFLLGTHNINFSIWPHEVSWISLRQLNGELQPRSELFFGGDAYYRSYTILATSDGGCLISASRYDFQTQYEEQDVYIRKLTKEEIITGLSHDLSVSAMVGVVYPNPGQDFINVISPYNAAFVCIYDMQGKLLKYQKIDTGKNVISTNSLKPGIYIYRVISESENVFSGRWIKK